MEEVREIYIYPLLAPVLSIFIYVCDNRIIDIMSKYRSPILCWRFYGTVGALNTNSIYYVGF